MDYHIVILIIALIYWIFSGIYKFFKAIAESVNKTNTATAQSAPRPIVAAGQSSPRPGAAAGQGADRRLPAPPLPRQEPYRRLTIETAPTRSTVDSYPELNPLLQDAQALTASDTADPNTPAGLQSALQSSFADLFQKPNNLLNAVILQEILGPPRSRRK